MSMTDIWRISSPNNDATVYVTDNGGNSRGPAMSPKDAQEIVTIHNMSRDPKVIVEFRSRVDDFLRKTFEDMLDPKDQRTSELYWPLMVLMSGTIVAMVESATEVQYPMVKLRDEPAISDQ